MSRDWFPKSMKGVRVLCLASGGGQQGPILAATGADVTVFDLSKRQLQQDQRVADEEGLDLKIVKGDMTDLSAFDGESFDIIVHPVANVFIESVRPVWKEAVEGETLEFGHTLEDQLQGQTGAGFVIVGFYEDDFGGGRTIDQHIKTMIATRAVKTRL